MDDDHEPSERRRPKRPAHRDGGDSTDGATDSRPSPRRHVRARSTIELRAEEPVLEIRDFNLWYGEKQALFDINMTDPARARSRR